MTGERRPKKRTGQALQGEFNDLECQPLQTERNSFFNTLLTISADSNVRG